ncbi:hypothetical protein GQX74_012988 [Glossina fuscipes]|nr:hypothetical protein GQX74_012988 [Glossina fuscipes]
MTTEHDELQSKNFSILSKISFITCWGVTLGYVRQPPVFYLEKFSSKIIKICITTNGGILSISPRSQHQRGSRPESRSYEVLRINRKSTMQTAFVLIKSFGPKHIIKVCAHNQAQAQTPMEEHALVYSAAHRICNLYVMNKKMFTTSAP